MMSTISYVICESSIVTMVFVWAYSAVNRWNGIPLIPVGGVIFLSLYEMHHFPLGPVILT